MHASFRNRETASLRFIAQLVHHAACSFALEAFPSPFALRSLALLRCNTAVGDMSAQPLHPSLNADTVAANEAAGTKESWASHPAAAVVQATVGRSVSIVLSDGRELQGTCTCFDWLGNLVLSSWTQNIPASPSGFSHPQHTPFVRCCSSTTCSLPVSPPLHPPAGAGDALQTSGAGSVMVSVPRAVTCDALGHVLISSGQHQACVQLDSHTTFGSQRCGAVAAQSSNTHRIGKCRGFCNSCA